MANGIIPQAKKRVDDYRMVFGTTGERNAAQERIWRDVVMDPILETSKLESKNPRKARDLSIEIFQTVEK